ncbi:MAG: hypothetical protein Q9192_005663 [Flavoplaca navasiana]
MSGGKTPFFTPVISYPINNPRTKNQAWLFEYLKSPPPAPPTPASPAPGPCFGLRVFKSAMVKFANRINLPFLAINRGHGSVSALGTFKHGVLIKLDNLTSIDIAADGKSAVLGG